jgi:hypothetical protein
LFTALGGSKSPCAMVQVESIGGSCSDVCSPITNELSRITGIVPDRIFVNFTSFKSDSWAVAGTYLFTYLCIHAYLLIHIGSTIG